MSFSEDADKRSKTQIIRTMAKHALTLAVRAKVSIKLLDSTEEDIECLIDNNFCDNIGVSPSEISKKIFNAKTWSKKLTNIVIRGGSSQTRQKIADICLARGLMANISKEGDIIKKIHMTQLIPIFNSFNFERFAMIKSFSEIPILLLLEIDAPMKTSTRNDFRYIIDSIIVDRENNRLPTIFTITDGVDDYKTNESGKRLSEIITNPSSNKIELVLI